MKPGPAVEAVALEPLGDSGRQSDGGSSASEHGGSVCMVACYSNATAPDSVDTHDVGSGRAALVGKLRMGPSHRGHLPP